MQASAEGVGVCAVRNAEVQACHDMARLTMLAPANAASLHITKIPCLKGITR